MPGDVQRLTLLAEPHTATLRDDKVLYGMQEVRGSNPLSSTLFAVQRHISILRMIFDFLPRESRRWPLTAGFGTGILARQGIPPVPGGHQSRRKAIPWEPKWEPMVIGASGAEHVSESRFPGKAAPSRLRAVKSRSGYLRVDARLPTICLQRAARSFGCLRAEDPVMGAPPPGGGVFTNPALVSC